MFRFLHFKQGVAGALTMFVFLHLLGIREAFPMTLRVMRSAGIWGSAVGWILPGWEQLLLWLSLATFINEMDPEGLWEFTITIV